MLNKCKKTELFTVTWLNFCHFTDSVMHQEIIQEDVNFSHYNMDYVYDGHLITLEDHLSDGPVICAVCYIIIICISLPGNCFLLWVLKKEGLKSSADWFLLHLTASDLIFTLMLIPWTIDNVCGWVFGELGCKLFNWGIFLGLYSYMTFLTVTTVHRYMVIVHPVFVTSTANRFRLYTHVSSSIAWLISIGFSLPEAFYSATVDNPDMVLCVLKYDSEFTETVGYFLQIILFFMLPFVVIAFCYARMGFTIHKSHMASRNIHNTACIIFCVVVGFFICWTPYNIFLFLVVLKSLDVPALMAWEISEMVYVICHILAFSHCCLNPLIQILGGKKFRRYLSWRSRRYTRHTFSTQSSFSRQTHLWISGHMTSRENEENMGQIRIYETEFFKSNLKRTWICKIRYTQLHKS